MSVQAVAEPVPAGERQILADSQGIDVADAAAIQITGTGVVDCMASTPKIIRRQRQHPDHPAGPVAAASSREERTVPAIMLDHEQADQQARGRQYQQCVEPEMSQVQGDEHHRPGKRERDRREREFEHTARRIWLAIAAQLPHPIPLIGLGMLVLDCQGHHCLSVSSTL